jgi:hypothetical protein
MKNRLQNLNTTQTILANFKLLKNVFFSKKVTKSKEGSTLEKNQI